MSLQFESALCENRKVSDSYYPWFFRGLGVSPGHNTPQRVSSADRELRRPLKSQGKIAHLTTVSFRKVQFIDQASKFLLLGPDRSRKTLSYSVQSPSDRAPTGERQANSFSWARIA